MRRCYSISSGASAPGLQRIAITIKRVPGGRVSTWFHERVEAGDVIDIGAPAGEFVVDETPDEMVMDVPRRLLFVAGGSGITPVMAILRDLERNNRLHDVVVIHAARTDEDAIFGRELAGMAGVRQIAHRDDHRDEIARRLIAHRDAHDGFLDAASLARHVPDLATREVYVCGPPPLIDLVTAVATAAGAPVHHERFVAPSPRSPAPAINDNTAAPVAIRLRGRSLAVAGTAPLLAELERAGERPAHGCRIGICNTCRCRKVSGTVEDLRTGAVSSAPDEDIRLCVSRARSDLELAL
jgi:ferredoxin-NADP reductase